MERSGSSKRLKTTARLPDDLMHIIFSKLTFTDKIYAGSVCKDWDQLLKAGTPATRHWVIKYNLDTILSRIDSLAAEGSTVDQLTIDIGRCADSGHPSLQEGMQLARHP
jgi:hypothetical protein